MSRLERDGLARVSAYSPAPLAGVDLDLRDNVNLWGPPPSARAAMTTAAATVATYPDAASQELSTLLAASIGVRANEVITGCGSDDIIDAFFRAVASPGERVAHADPTFGMVPTFARVNALEPIAVPLRPDGAADVDGLLATGARIIYLCSPNNPTGTITPEPEIARLLAHAPGVVLIDEAYGEFSGERSWLAAAPSFARVLVTRTFSKAWGLAGLRVGYATGAPSLIDAVAKARGPYKVNRMAAAAAEAALRHDGRWMETHAREACVARDALTRALLGRAGVRPFASRGNFVFACIESKAADVAVRFADRGIGIRAFSGLRDIGEAIRIGVAPPAELARVIRAIEEEWPCA